MAEDPRLTSSTSPARFSSGVLVEPFLRGTEVPFKTIVKEYIKSLKHGSIMNKRKGQL
jgi:hypothetical protein